MQVIGVAEFSSRTRKPLDIPLTVYAFSEMQPRSILFDQSRSILRYFTDLIGPFPYEKLAQVSDHAFIGGMENASAIFIRRSFPHGSLGPISVARDCPSMFGDSITQDDWDHLCQEGSDLFRQSFQEHLQGPELKGA